MKILKIILLLILLSPVMEIEAHDDSKPWTFWYWMYGAVSTEAITADLEWMKEIGLGGTYLMPIRGIEEGKQHEGKAQQLSPEWWRMVKHSFNEADRLGLKMGLHICDGFALAGGPWITPKESMQKIVWSDTIISGGKIKNMSLPLPKSFKGYYEDIATYAIPIEKLPQDISIIPKITVKNLAKGEVKDLSKVVNIDNNGVIRSSYPCYIQYEYPSSITVRNIEIILSGNNYQAHRLKVLAGDDGVNFREIKQLTPARHGWQNTDAASTHSIYPTTARYFRFEWTPVGSEPGSEDLDAAKWRPNLKIKQIVLHTEPRINQWEGKAGYVWRVSEETKENEIPHRECIKLDEIRTFTLNSGSMTASLPKGEWKIIRMGHTSTGHTNATAGGGRGLECDKFSVDAVNKQFNNWFGEIYRNLDLGVAKRVLKYMHVDSWECGSQNWSDNFASEFARRRGYDLMPYLPLMAGIPIESASISEKVLRDVRTTIGELVTDVFYTVLSEKAKEYDCKLSGECVAPTMVADGLLHYKKVDHPMGEFWLNSPTHDKPNDMLDAISGAHIYGKKIIQAEGFTEVRGVWNEDFAMLKPLLDRNFALGINKLFFHVTAHNPWLDRKPGMTLEGIGLFFQRDQTWSRESKAFVDYVTRCQKLLQYGDPVIDIAVFTGEEMPRRAILPDRLVTMLPGVFGEKRVKSEEKRLKNVGEPLRVMPVGVTHSANMADPENWINPMNGYAYDSFNKDVLVNRATVRDGKMILPGGAEYKVVILPTARPMNPNNIPLSKATKDKIEELRRGGVIIPTIPYNGDFESLGLEKDVILPENVAWTHRRGEEMDIYFLSNQSKEKRQFTASFRINGGIAEIWNPVTGGKYKPKRTVNNGNRTDVDITLDVHESIFVVFPKTASKDLENELEYAGNIEYKAGDWKIEFPLIDKVIIRRELFDWSKDSDEKIKYYSGTAIYKNNIKVNRVPKGKLFIKFDNLYNMATVTINGKRCGTIWSAPYELDVTDALGKGNNLIEIEVTNTWANALRGSDNNKAPFEGIWTNAKYRMEGDELLPAGMVSPIEFIYKK